MLIVFKYIVICGILPIIVTSSHKHKLVAPVVAQVPTHPIAEPVQAPIPETTTLSPVVAATLPPTNHAHKPKMSHAPKQEHTPPSTTVAPQTTPEPIPPVDTTTPAPTSVTPPDKHDAKNAAHPSKHSIPIPVPIPLPVPIPIPSHQKNNANPNATQTQLKNDTPFTKTDTPHSDANETKIALSYRLPSDIVPYEYDLWLKVDLDNITFSGHVSIGLTVLKPTSTVTLHYKDIIVDWKYGRLLNSQGQKMQFVNGSDRFEEEMYDLTYKNILSPGNYNLTVSFHGDIRSDLKGLSRYKYMFEGQEKYLASTYFSRTHARQVFPCFDEPAMKANFSITILSDDKFQVLSNMPQISRSEPLIKFGNFSQTIFQTSLKMSTYLVAFIVAQDLAVYTEGNGKVKFYATVNQIHRTPRSYAGAMKAINLLETFLDSKIPIPKIDLISLPQFASGAMENWGLITFKDPFMFHDFDDFSMTLRNQESSTLMITHELTHNWFGNEVTQEWWTYLWLSEGFARYFEFYLGDQIEPTWHLLDQFVITNTRGVMRFDDSALIRPMSTEVLAPNIINSLNDCITYEKSSSVIRMMMHMFGVEIFRKSLHDFISAHSFKTSNQTQLFDSFEHRVKNAKIKLPTTVNNIMAAWTNDAGYPLITVTRDFENSSIIVSQKHFLTDEDYRNLVWPGKYVPISIVTSLNANFSNTLPDFWLVPKINSTRRPVSGLNKTNTWIVLNKQQTGYYRVKYDRDNWKLLENVLKSSDFERIHNLNRAALIDDAFNLARAGEQDFDIALDLMQYLSNETDYAVWEMANDLLVMLEKYHRGHSSYEQFEKFVQHITAKAYESLRLVTNERDHLTRKKREIVAKLACRHGLKKCIDDAKTVFRDRMDHGKLIPDEIQETVFCTAAKYWYGSVQEMNKHLFELFLKDRSNVMTEVLAIINGFGCSQDENSIKSALDLTLATLGSTEFFEPANRNIILSAIIGDSYKGTKVGLQFLIDNFDNILSKYSSVDTIIRILESNILSNDLMNLFKNFTAKHSIKFDATANTTIDYVAMGSVKTLLFAEKHHEYFGNYWSNSNIEGIGNNSAADKNLDINNSLLVLAVCFSIKKILFYF